MGRPRKNAGEVDVMAHDVKFDPVRFWFQPEFEGDLRLGAVRMWAGNTHDGYESLGTLRMKKEEFDAWQKAHGGQAEKDEAHVINGVAFYWQKEQPAD
jgi:hypothetical protein